MSFILEIDAKILAVQFNRFGIDLPDTLIIRWLAQIRLFNFEIRHVPDIKHTAVDGFSKRPRSKSDNKNEKYEMNINDYIDAEFNCVRVLPIIIINGEAILDREYSDQSFFIVKYISDLQRFPDMDRKAFRAFRAEAYRYMLKDRYLFRRASKNIFMRCVVDSAVQRKRIFKNLHNEGGHRDRKNTYRRVANRYW